MNQDSHRSVGEVEVDTCKAALLHLSVPFQLSPGPARDDSPVTCCPICTANPIIVLNKIESFILKHSEYFASPISSSSSFANRISSISIAISSSSSGSPRRRAKLVLASCQRPWWARNRGLSGEAMKPTRRRDVQMSWIPMKVDQGK